MICSVCEVGVVPEVLSDIPILLIIETKEVYISGAKATILQKRSG